MANGLVGRHQVAVVSLLAALLFSIDVHAALSLDPVPPFQWLNLSALLQGTTQPPGLKDAAMGYDEARSVYPRCLATAPYLIITQSLINYLWGRGFVCSAPVTNLLTQP
ncbi:hypothetical protein B0H12DRAFT_18429 [Mycena haematopus]|nr:hypothetical protein B0H12DRAFT_18429 [Mycena haematopus]